jgi:hypothetical protein
MRTRSARGRAAVAAVLSVVLSAALVSCGDGGDRDEAGGLPATQPSTQTPSAEPTAPVPPSPASPEPTSVPFVATAADQLAGYFAGAARVDARLREVARVVNRSVTVDGASFDAATVAALAAADPAAIAGILPAGMPPDLLRAVLLVHSDLLSRHAAFRWVEAGQLPPQQVQQLVECLPNGGPAARRFAGDLTAARALAASTPEVPGTPASSRAAGELAVRLASLHLGSTGCGACGQGGAAETLPTLVWDTGTTGRIGETGFTARPSGASWDVAFDVC